MTEISVDHIARCSCCGSEGYEICAASPDFEYATCSNEFRFARCSECGVVYLHDRPTLDNLDVIYPPDYIPHRFNEHLGPAITRLRDRVQGRKVEALKPYARRDAVIVDVGPGNGELLKLIRDHGDSSWRLIGVDFADEAVAAVRSLGLEAVQARFEDVEWQYPAPDVIVMNQVIEHLEDPAASVRKAAEMLAPGGVLFVETPSLAGWDATLFSKRYWGGWHTPRHWHLFDATSLGRLFESNGFDVVETTHILSPNFWLQSVHHAVCEKWGWDGLADLFDVRHFPMLALASAIDVVQRALTGKTSNFRMVARPRASMGTTG